MDQVVLDLDDVQADLFRCMRHALNGYTGLDRTPAHFNTFNITEVYPGLQMDEFFNLLICDKILENLKPLEGAAEATRTMKSAGLTINVVTARDWHPEGKNLSIDWLERHGFVFDRLEVTCPNISKEVAYRKFGAQFELIADDHMKNINHAIDSKLFKRVAVIDKPWNRWETGFEAHGQRYSSLLDVALELAGDRHATYADTRKRAQ